MDIVQAELLSAFILTQLQIIASNIFEEGGNFK
jgi:hypothetical protein